MSAKQRTYDKLSDLKEKVNNKGFYFEDDNKELLRVLIVIAENLAEISDSLKNIGSEL